jgi:hypothetical protein
MTSKRLAHRFDPRPMLPTMPPPLFKLAVFGRRGDTQATLSAYDQQGGFKALAEAINVELSVLPRERGREELSVAAEKILRRHGLVGPNAGG